MGMLRIIAAGGATSMCQSDARGLVRFHVERVNSHAPQRGVDEVKCGNGMIWAGDFGHATEGRTWRKSGSESTGTVS